MNSINDVAFFKNYRQLKLHISQRIFVPFNTVQTDNFNCLGKINYYRCFVSGKIKEVTGTLYLPSQTDDIPVHELSFFFFKISVKISDTLSSILGLQLKNLFLHKIC